MAGEHRLEIASLFILFALLLAVAFDTPEPTLTGMAPHTDARFSATHDVTYSWRSLLVKDTVIYRQGWYSIDGTPWEPFELQGINYPGTQHWISNSATTDTLPAAITETGTHYLLTYSCSKAGAEWDCHGGKWQLSTVNNTQEDPPMTAQVVGVRSSEDQEDLHLPGLTLDGVRADDSCWAALGDNQWVEYELSDVADVSFVEIAFYADSSRTFEIETSLDGASWSSATGEVNSTPDSAHEWQRFAFEPVQARYVRFLGHGSSVSGREGWNAFSEMNINDFTVNLTEPPCVPNTNECGPDGCGESHGDCVAGTCVNGVCETDMQVLFQMDFEQRDPGKYGTRAEFEQDWNTNGWGNRGEDFEIITDPDDPSNQIGMITYPFYDSEDFVWICWGDDQCQDSEWRRIIFDEKNDNFGRWTQLRGVGPSSGGSQWYISLGGEHTSAYYSYRLRLPPDFDPVSGGKLPLGFFPDQRPCGCENSDCEYADGVNCHSLPETDPRYKPKTEPCDGVTDDFTAGRYMFHTGHISYYVYFADKNNLCGDSAMITGSDIIFDGEWHTIKAYVRLNDPDEHNGVMRTWIDGVERNSWTGIMFRTGDTSLSLDTLAMSTFFGGDSGEMCERTISWDNMCNKGSIDEWIQPKYNICAVDPEDPCSDVLRYSDGSPYYYYAPRKTEHLWIDDIVVYRQ